MTEILTSNSTQLTDIAYDLTSNSNLTSFLDQSGTIRFTCNDVDSNELRFVVSEDCATTDPGVTIKNIYDLSSVASHISALTLNTSAYQLCYDYKTWTEFDGF